MNYNLQGKITFAEYLDAHKTNRRKQLMLVRSVLIVIALLIIVLSTQLTQFNNTMDNVILGFGIGFLIYALIVSPIKFHYLVKRNWRRYSAIHKQQSLSFSDQGMIATDDVGNPVTTLWHSFIKWEESEYVFLLYVSNLLWVTVPKRWLKDQEVDTFRALLKTKIHQYNDTEEAQKNGKK